MLAIRLRRIGRKNAPVFDLVVSERSQHPKSGAILERLGLYEVTRDPAVFTIQKDRIEHWISVGAQPSETVARLLHKEGMANMDKYLDFNKRYAKRNKKAVEEEAGGGSLEGGGEEAKQESAPTENGEAPKEEAVVEEAPAVKEETPTEESAPEEESE
jgi:small subunit ribosomal protein S16